MYCTAKYFKRILCCIFLCNNQEKKFENLYFIFQESEGEPVIQRDINRTFPAHDFFKESGGIGQESLFKISKVSKTVGYLKLDCKNDEKLHTVNVKRW